MKNLPVTIKFNHGKIRPPQSANVPTVQAMSQMDFKATSEAMMRLSGKAETRTITANCTRHDKPFVIVFERKSSNHRFQIAEIAIIEAETGFSGFLDKLFAPKTKNEPVKYDINDFDYSGQYCPHCGYSKTYVQCSGCKQHVCGSRINTLPNGGQLFACSDSCGNTGKLQPCNYIYSSTHNTAPRKINKPAPILAIQHTKTTTLLLPKPKQKLLGHSGKAGFKLFK